MSNKDNQSEIGVEEMQKAALVCLRDTSTGEIRAYVEVLSSRLGFSHAIDINLPSPPVETQEEMELRRLCVHLAKITGTPTTCDDPRGAVDWAISLLSDAYPISPPVERTQDEPFIRIGFDGMVPDISHQELWGNTEPTAAGSEEPKCAICDACDADHNFLSGEHWHKFVAAPVASQAPPPESAPKRPDVITFASNPWDYGKQAEAYMDYSDQIYILEGQNNLNARYKAEARVRELEEAQEGWSANAMEHLGRVRAAKEIIEQYPPMVRNILGGKAVRNVSELEASAKSWLEANHDRT